jgi:hypothetical protein
MKRPSDRALGLAEEIMDHVRYGLTRTDALYELAEMIDEHNDELLSAIGAALRDAERHGGLAGPDTLAELRETARDYRPLRTAADDHPDLFVEQPAALF